MYAFEFCRLVVSLWIVLLFFELETRVVKNEYYDLEDF